MNQFKSKLSLLPLVNLIPQLPRAFKINTFPGIHHHIITGSRVPAFALILLNHTKFTES
jgi:hypothetical protein